MQTIEMYLCAVIYKYATDGWEVRLYDKHDYDYFMADEDSSIVLLKTVHVTPPAPEWLAEHGLAEAEKQREEAAKDYHKTLARVAEFESKFLCLESPITINAEA